jgi:hypothetical protein
MIMCLITSLLAQFVESVDLFSLMVANCNMMRHGHSTAHRNNALDK